MGRSPFRRDAMNLALDVIARMGSGSVEGIKQDRSLVTKAPKLTKEHGVIDWTRPAEAVCNHIRAMQPWPTAYTFWHGAGHPPVRLLILKGRARAESGPEGATTPCAIYATADGKSLCVRAGEGVVEVTELQPAGKKRMSAAEWVRGQNLAPGTKFGG